MSMGIYIKGMELPEDKEIFLRIDEKGEVYVYGSYPTELHKAVPVPPHGDLMDRNAYLEEMNNHIQDEAYFAVANSMPTIIEAEGKE